MNPDQEELFQSIILDHNAAPRNFYEMDDASHSETGLNPVCGDRFVFFLDIVLDIDEGRIRRASFQGRGCAISTASASMMASMLPGKTIREAEAIRDALTDTLTSSTKPDSTVLGDLEALTGVRKHPSRIACVMLAWDAMTKSILATKF